MPAGTSDSNPSSFAAERFSTTHWTVVLAAASDSPQAREAIEALCRSYWHPIYYFVRRQGHTSHDAQDLTQGFFERLLKKRWPGAADPAKGRFRSYLLGALKHFLADARDRQYALKRGGRHLLVSLDDSGAELHGTDEPADRLSADKLFDRRWCLTLLEHALAGLRAQYAATGKGGFFEQVKDCLMGDRTRLPYAELAARLGMSEAGVKVAVHRLRQRYREVLRQEVSRTVANTNDVESELRHLLEALRD